MFSRGLKTLSILTALLLTSAFTLIFFYTPNDADQGFIQKIFYLHVPLAIVTLLGFVVGGFFGIRFLMTRNRDYDMKSYVAIHVSLMLGLVALLTGSIWAKASWGHWWVWEEPTLVSFLIVFLLFATYQPLRFSISDPMRQARIAAVFSVIAGAFVPINFLAVRLAQSLIHPRVLTSTGAAMPGSMRFTFLLSIAAIGCLALTMWKYELVSKNTKIKLRALKRDLALSR